MSFVYIQYRLLNAIYRTHIGEESYPSAAMQSVYSTLPTGLAVCDDCVFYFMEDTWNL